LRPQQEGSAGPGLERARALVPRTPFPGPGISRVHGLQIALQANTTAVVLPHDGLQVSASPCPCALYAPHLQVECADHPRARLRHHCDKESPLQLEQRTALYHLAAFVGVLVLVALGGAALLYPGMQSGNSVPPGAPALQVTQNGSAATCAGGTYPAITLTNASQQALQWTANTQDAHVTATPSGGSLAPGASVTVSLGGATSTPAVIVQFRAGSQTAGTTKFGCQSGASGR